MLAAGTARPRRPREQLVARDDDALVYTNAVERIVGHRLARRGSGCCARAYLLAILTMHPQPGNSAAIQRDDLELAPRERNAIANLRKAAEAAERVAA